MTTQRADVRGLVEQAIDAIHNDAPVRAIGLLNQLSALSAPGEPVAFAQVVTEFGGTVGSTVVRLAPEFEARLDATPDIEVPLYLSPHAHAEGGVKPCRYSTTKQQREDAWHGRKGGMKTEHRCLEHGGFQYEPGDEKCYRADDTPAPVKVACQFGCTTQAEHDAHFTAPVPVPAAERGYSVWTAGERWDVRGPLGGHVATCDDEPTAVQVCAALNASRALRGTVDDAMEKCK